MEKLVKIPTSNNRKIYCKIRGPLSRPVIVFVHGLTSDMEEHIFFNGTRFLEKHGYSSLRFDLYGYNSNQRKMKDCTLKIHAHDLDLVLAYLRRRGVKKICVIGHSYGGPAILYSNKKDFDLVIFWDSSYGKSAIFPSARFNKILGEWIYPGRFDFIIGNAMVKECRGSNFGPMVKKISVPIKIICAGKGVLKKRGQSVF